jgi:hypothetical protein
MTTTAIAMPFETRRDPTEGCRKVDNPSPLGNALTSSWPGLFRLEKLHPARSHSSRLAAPEPSTAGVSLVGEVVLQFARTMQEQFAWTEATEREPLFGFEVELPPWKGPDPIPVEVIVQSVKRGTFRPITEDDFGGI